MEPISNILYPQQQKDGKHIGFERADKARDFNAMFAMLSESEDVRDYLTWHMKMTRGCFGPYKIESHAAFAPLLHLVVDAKSEQMIDMLGEE